MLGREHLTDQAGSVLEPPRDNDEHHKGCGADERLRPKLHRDTEPNAEQRLRDQPARPSSFAFERSQQRRLPRYGGLSVAEHRHGALQQLAHFHGAAYPFRLPATAGIPQLWCVRPRWRSADVLPDRRPAGRAQQPGLRCWLQRLRADPGKTLDVSTGEVNFAPPDQELHHGDQSDPIGRVPHRDRHGETRRGVHRDHMHQQYSRCACDHDRPDGHGDPDRTNRLGDVRW